MPPVSDVQLTDLTTLKQWLNISASDTSADTALTRLITVATGIFKRLVNRPVFIESTLTETYYGSGLAFLSLKTNPVTSVLSVQNQGQFLVSESDFTFNQYGVVGLKSTWGKREKYIIIYIAGYPLNSEEAYMAEQAVCSIINLWWKRRPHADELARSLGQQITARYTEDDIPPEADAIIRGLKRVA